MADSRTIQNFRRVILWTSVVCLAWLFMQVVHELGHIAAAILTGGTIVLIDLHPLHISHTLVSPNPNPLIVIWTGPLFGVGLPLVLWVMCRRFLPGKVHYFQFFAGFCLIANGAYLGSAIFDAVGDARELVNQNVSLLYLLTFSVLTIPSGFLLWNNQGAKFGIGKDRKEITSKESTIALALLVSWVGSASLIFPITFVD